MVKGLIGFAAAFVFAGLAWLLAFGATAPCDAMTAQARALVGETKDAREKMIAEYLATSKPEQFSVLECTSLAVRMKVVGSPGVKVLGGAQKK